MQDIAEITPVKAATGNDDWTLWVRQIWATVRLESRKNLFGKERISGYAFALLPILLAVAVAILNPEATGHDIGARRAFFAGVFEVLIIRVTIFLSCSQICIALFQNEQTEQTLHYSFLAPIRRDLLVVGKYVFGLIASHMILCVSVLVAFLIFFTPVASEASFNVDVRHAIAYLGVTSLACIGYGAVFLLIGTVFRNPHVLMGIFFAFEWANIFFPPILKKLSIAYYLHSLLPVALPEEILSIIVEPASPAVAIISIFALAALSIAGTALYIRKMEIRYQTD